MSMESKKLIAKEVERFVDSSVMSADVLLHKGIKAKQNASLDVASRERENIKITVEITQIEE